MNVRRSLLLFLALPLAACTAQNAAFELHTDRLDCDEANRYVYDALLDMKMQVTSFRPAKPGAPGEIRGRRSSDGTAGSVTVTCASDGVHIDPDQSGTGLDKHFERGVFLSVSGRSGLEVDRGKITGRDPAKAHGSSIDPPAAASGSTAAVVAPGGGIRVHMQPLKGFSTLLDFDADLSAAGVLPIKVTVRNGSARAYDFDPDDVHVRVRGSRARAVPLGIDGAQALLQAAGSDVGDVPSALKIMRERRVRSGRMQPGDTASGYLYYPRGDYDRAKITMTDVATGEIEGFMVEF